MYIRRHLLALLILFSWWFPSLSWAQTEELTVGNHAGIDARVMGMGGAFTGVADNGSALHWNPAGLIQLSAFDFTLGLSAIDQNAEATLLSSGDARTSARMDIRLNELSGVFPLASGQRLVLALGVHRVQNLDLQVDVAGELGPEAPVLSEMAIDERSQDSGSLYTWRVGLAGLASPHIAVGSTLDIYTGDHKEELRTDITDPNDVEDIASQTLVDTLDRSYLGLGIRLGGLARLGWGVQLGALLHLPLTLEVDEYWTQETLQRNDDGEKLRNFDDGTQLYDIRFPFDASVGLSVKVGRFRLATDVQYTNWTSTTYSRPPVAGVSNRNFQDFYRDVVQWRVGAEYMLYEPSLTRLRVGYWLHPLAFTANTIPDERDFFTAGVGTVLDETVELNVAYVRGAWRQASDVLEKRLTTHEVYVSASYRYSP